MCLWNADADGTVLDTREGDRDCSLGGLGLARVAGFPGRCPRSYPQVTSSMLVRIYGRNPSLFVFISVPPIELIESISTLNQGSTVKNRREIGSY